MCSEHFRKLHSLWIASTHVLCYPSLYVSIAVAKLRMSALPLLSICFVTVVAFGLVWLFEPTIHYFDSVNVNTMSKVDYTMIDRYVIFDCV